MDAPLQGSHYDWFWPDEGWETRLLLISPLCGRERQHERKHSEGGTVNYVIRSVLFIFLVVYPYFLCTFAPILAFF